MPNLADLLKELNDLNIPSRLIRLPGDLYDMIVDWGEEAVDAEYQDSEED
jgi:hypothetical protein